MAVNIKKDYSNNRSKNLDLVLNMGRVPPQSIDLEKAVIGACLLERDAFEAVAGIIHTEEVFYLDAHKKIWKAANGLYGAGMPIDLLTVTDALSKTNELEIVGGAYALTILTMSVTSSAHIVAHARIIFEKHMKREMIRVCGSAINDAYDDSSDPFDLVDATQNAITAIQDGVSMETISSVGEVFMEVSMDIENQMEAKTDLIGITSGYADVDELTLGWQRENLIIVAARPSQGKSALALNFAMNAKAPTLFFSLENGKKPLTKRLAAAKTGIDFKKVQTGRMTREEKERFDSYFNYFKTLPIYIDDKTFSFERILQKCRKWAKTQRKKNHEQELIIMIDYLQLMSVSGKGNREQEIATMSRKLKELAAEISVPIIALSQLNRGVETRGDKKPMLSDLRESGAIEQDANVVCMIWWEKVEHGFKTWLVFLKNRDGKTGDVELKFNGDIQRWVDVNDRMLPVPAAYLTTAYRDPSQANTKSDWDDFATPKPENPSAGITRQHFQEPSEKVEDKYWTD